MGACRFLGGRGKKNGRISDKLIHYINGQITDYFPTYGEYKVYAEAKYNDYLTG